jgi:hypothetical protein
VIAVCLQYQYNSAAQHRGEVKFPIYVQAALFYGLAHETGIPECSFSYS